MTTQHTAGRLCTQLETFSISPTGDCDLSFLIRTQTDLSLIGEVYGCDDMAESNARRLVACWNACEGLPTDLLEDESIMKIDSRIRQERDELLEAVCVAEHTFRHYANLHAAKGPEGADKAARNTELADRMAAAIAKVEGGAK